ncbi:YaaA family protein [Georgenia satyanarayanai]|uniref:YaaA family protein n=1 Tax=Georgenia satyanarayanai TaxID=860221 RepID=UPI001265136D|nr:peroxide stress protein YaaA [Georgenia satyanarayanai]
MLILLPPSESKSTRSRGRAADPAALSFRELVGPRRTVAAELAAVSARPDALEVLGVGASLVEEVAANLRLDTAPALPVRELYTGVLYDALDLDGMDAVARRRAARWTVVVSALHGALRLSDRVAPYRLAMNVTLPGTGPLARFWREHLDVALTTAAGDGVVVDCRSSTYAAAGSPRGSAAATWVQVRVPGASHMAKHTRGLVAGHLCRTGASPRTPQRLAEELDGAFTVVGLSAPARAGRPWVLDVTAE